eukprot:jgi/Botrbrau1/386/Bobra.110_2s0041.1
MLSPDGTLWKKLLPSRASTWTLCMAPQSPAHHSLRGRCYCFRFCAVSSAASVFATMLEVPTLTLSAWRLQTYWTLDAGTSSGTNVSTASRIAKSSLGACPSAAGNLGFPGIPLRALGTKHTTPLASRTVLLCVSATPVLLAVGAFLLRQPISFGEIGGTLVALVGGGLLSCGAHHDAEVTLLGDLAALGGSAAIIGYLLIGRRLRMWMPTFTYAGPVTVAAAAVLTMAAMALEGGQLDRAGRPGVSGWLLSQYAPRVLYLAVVPGHCGPPGLKYAAPVDGSLDNFAGPKHGAFSRIFDRLLSGSCLCPERMDLCRRCFYDNGNCHGKRSGQAGGSAQQHMPGTGASSRGSFRILGRPTGQRRRSLLPPAPRQGQDLLSPVTGRRG